jgi:hypothetical protein
VISIARFTASRLDLLERGVESIASPLRAAQTKVSRLPFGPGSPEEARPRTTSPSDSAAPGDLADRLSAVGGVADDSGLPHLLLAELELRLDEPEQVELLRAVATIEGISIASEMKETSAVITSGRKGRWESPR